MEDDKRERGRPTKYRDEYAEQARKLCEMGATDYEIARFFDVDTVTVHRWRIQHNDFCNAVRAGKDNADERVVRSLFNRAVGYTFESEKVFQNSGQIVRAEIIEHVPPDPSAALNWLKNRRPKEWRDKQDHEHSGPDGGPIVVTDAERAAALLAFMAKTKGG